jgi:NADPH-dependent ferric siderophore reductase
MATDRLPQAGGTLAEPSLWHLRVVDTRPLSDTLQRVILTAPGLEGLQCAPGQDMMLRVPRPDGKMTNRRYTIRSFDGALPTVTLDVSLHGAGPGTDWIRTARIGDELDALGPRGKITPRTDADWHLFIGDETGMPGALAMIEALPSATTVMALLEVDSPGDEQEPDSQEREALELRWVHRFDESVPGDASRLLAASADIALPVGVGHVYVAAEAGVVQSIQQQLAERGLPSDQISAKAYWRRGLPNADHGEPVRPG